MVGDTRSPEPVDEEPTIFKAGQYTLDVLLITFMPKLPHGSKHGHRVVAQCLDGSVPFELALPVPFNGFCLGCEMYVLIRRIWPGHHGVVGSESDKEVAV